MIVPSIDATIPYTKISRQPANISIDSPPPNQVFAWSARFVNHDGFNFRHLAHGLNNALAADTALLRPAKSHVARAERTGSINYDTTDIETIGELQSGADI